jgi:hypothetical protein
MSHRRKLQSGSALLAAAGLAASTIAPMVMVAPALAQSTFSDVQGSFAERCIQNLAQRNIISGYPDGTFRPNAPVTRAEFAAIVNKAFPNAETRQSARAFVDVPSNYWASAAIRQASQTSFLSGYPDGTFRPNQNIPRAQVLVSLNNGLGYSATGSVDSTLSASFNDAGAIPDYARGPIASATQRQLVVSFPNPRFLNPNQSATRADVAAFVCQSLTGSSQASLISSQYIAGAGVSESASLSAGTTIPVAFASERVVVAAQETAPLSLTVAADVTNNQGVVVIPAGSTIEGQLRPTEGGSQFVAQTLVIGGRRLPISASSAVVTRTQNVRDPNFKTILGGAALGAGAAAGISTVLGDRSIDASEVLVGAGVGAAVGSSINRPITSVIRDAGVGAAIATGISAITGDRRITAEKSLGGAAAGATLGSILLDRSRGEVVVINPDTDLTLTLNSNLSVR